MLKQQEAFILRMEREQWKATALTAEFNASDDFEMDEDIKVMRRRYSSEFVQKFQMAFANYEAGEWEV